MDHHAHNIPHQSDMLAVVDGRLALGRRVRGDDDRGDCGDLTHDRPAQVQASDIPAQGEVGDRPVQGGVGDRPARGEAHDTLVHDDALARDTLVHDGALARGKLVQAWCCKLVSRDHHGE